MSTEKNDNQHGFAFGPTNYKIMIAGIVVILIGFILMVGGGSKDPNVFNPEIFSTQRITVAPIVVLIGFAIEVFAIVYKPKN
jgi:membrane-bound ClpP family serine protease